ncbi:AIDA repeat-containing protein [Escherichia coli]
MEAFGTNRLGQFEIKNGIANNMLLENGGSLRVEENDFAYNTTVDSGGLLEVMDGGTVTGVDKKAGGKLIVSTNALEVSGTNSKGQFSIKDGVSKNYELDDGSGLIVMEDTQAIDTILDEHATMQSLGKDTGSKCRQMRYMISVDQIRMEVSRIPQKPFLKIWLSTMAALTSGLAQWLTFQSEGMMAFLRS